MHRLLGLGLFGKLPFDIRYLIYTELVYDGSLERRFNFTKLLSHSHRAPSQSQLDELAKMYLLNDSFRSDIKRFQKTHGSNHSAFHLLYARSIGFYSPDSNIQEFYFDDKLMNLIEVLNQSLQQCVSTFESPSTRIFRVLAKIILESRYAALIEVLKRLEETFPASRHDGENQVLKQSTDIEPHSPIISHLRFFPTKCLRVASDSETQFAVLMMTFKLAGAGLKKLDIVIIYDEFSMKDIKRWCCFLDQSMYERYPGVEVRLLVQDFSQQQGQWLQELKSEFRNYLTRLDSELMILDFDKYLDWYRSSDYSSSTMWWRVDGELMELDAKLRRRERLVKSGNNNEW